MTSPDRAVGRRGDGLDERQAPGVWVAVTVAVSVGEVVGAVACAEAMLVTEPASRSAWVTV